MADALHPEADELRGIYLFSVLDDEQLKAILDTTRVVRLPFSTSASPRGISSI